LCEEIGAAVEARPEPPGERRRQIGPSAARSSLAGAI
jgi:hypothetical protein